jgi:hypothetical protein
MQNQTAIPTKTFTAHHILNYNNRGAGTIPVVEARDHLALRYFCARCDLMIGRYNTPPNKRWACICGCNSFLSSK